jgi:hypothetical protein
MFKLLHHASHLSVGLDFQKHLLFLVKLITKFNEERIDTECFSSSNSCMYTHAYITSSLGSIRSFILTEIFKNKIIMTDFEINDEETIVDRTITPNMSDVQEEEIEDLDKIKTCISSKKYSLKRKRMIEEYRSFVDCSDISISCFSQFHDHEKCFEVVDPKIDDRYINHIHIKKALSCVSQISCVYLSLVFFFH